MSEAETTASLATDSGWLERSTLSQLSTNVALNGLDEARVDVAELMWGSQRHITAVRQRWGPFDTVIASDVLYYPPATYSRLAETIRDLTATGGAVVLSYKVRHGGEDRFVDLLTDAASGFPFKLVRESDCNTGEGVSSRVRVVTLARVSDCAT